MLTVPAVAMSAAVMAPVTCVPLTNVVVRFAPLNCTVAPLAKPVPFTVSVKPTPPAVTLAREREWRLGMARGQHHPATSNSTASPPLTFRAHLASQLVHSFSVPHNGSLAGQNEENLHCNSGVLCRVGWHRDWYGRIASQPSGFPNRCTAPPRGDVTQVRISDSENGCEHAGG